MTLTPVQFAALAAVRAFAGVDQATAAGLIAYDKATLGKVIDKLDACGLVRRNTSTTDRRAKEFVATDAGEAPYACSLPHVEDLQDDTLCGLNRQERDTLLRLLDSDAGGKFPKPRAASTAGQADCSIAAQVIRTGWAISSESDQTSRPKSAKCHRCGGHARRPSLENEGDST